MSNYDPSSVTVTTTKAQILPMNTSRQALILFNQGPGTVQIVLSDEDTAYFKLNANEGIKFDDAPFNKVSARTDSGTAILSVLGA